MGTAWTCLALAVVTLYARHKAEPRLQRLAVEQQRTPGVAVLAEAATVLALIAFTSTALIAALTA